MFELNSNWTLRALNLEAVPETLREPLKQGIPATVPGEATLDLVRAGLIADPFDGDNETLQQWIGDVDWQLTTTFDWHDDGNTRHDLVAEGLDTVAQIRLNGRAVGATENFHRSYRWDVRGLLQEGENTLEVQFTSPVRESDRREQDRGYLPHTEHHAFNQLRKPSYSFGWDWGIDVANAGIVRPIYIDSWSEVRIANVRPLVDVDRHGNGTLTVTARVERAGKGRIMSPNDAHKRPEVLLTVTVDGYGTHTSSTGTVLATATHGTVVVDVPDVQLWWPLGYGEQPLYNVTVEARLINDATADAENTIASEGAIESASNVSEVASEGAAEGVSQAQVNNVTASWQSRVGFRTVRVDTAADEIGRPFQIYVNDVPVHARGYNWIPDDAYISRVSHADYERGIRDLVESNSNMVRVWGGGVYEPDEFYDLCDEHGVMVWQDFMLACASYAEDSFTKAQVEAEAREQITRLSTHPSLVVWNGSNENYVANAQWGGHKQAVRADDMPAGRYGYGEHGWGEYYYATLLPQLLAELDPTRVYIESSPMSFTANTDANLDTDGTMHIWDVWNRVDYRKYAEYTPRFADEFGYQAPPAFSTLTQVVHDTPLEPFGTQMLVHQKASGGNIKLARGMRSHITPGKTEDVSINEQGERSWLLPTDIWDNIEDWHWACQLQQAQAIRFGVEHMRSLEPVNAGALIWQLNDDWPVVSWAAVDYNGIRKPLWYASRDFFAPRFATIQPRVSAKAQEDYNWEGERVAKPDHLELIVLNDTREAAETSWHLERVTFDGTVLAETDVEITLNAIDHQSVLIPAELANFDVASNELLVATERTNAGFARVIYNPAEIIDQQLRSDALEAECEPEQGGYRLTVRANSYVRDAFAMVDKVDANARIDGGMVSLLAGESVTWHITSEAEVSAQDFTAARVVRSANDLKK